MPMRAIEAESFRGYGGLRQTELPKPQPAKDRVLVRVTAAGVTPLEYTVLSGELGFEDVVDLSAEGLAEGVRRITAGKGVDIVVEGIGGAVGGRGFGGRGRRGGGGSLGSSGGRETKRRMADLRLGDTRKGGFFVFRPLPAAGRGLRFHKR